MNHLVASIGGIFIMCLVSGVLLTHTNSITLDVSYRQDELRAYSNRLATSLIDHGGISILMADGYAAYKARLNIVGLDFNVRAEPISPDASYLKVCLDIDSLRTDACPLPSTTRKPVCPNLSFGPEIPPWTETGTVSRLDRIGACAYRLSVVAFGPP